MICPQSFSSSIPICSRECDPTFEFSEENDLLTLSLILQVHQDSLRYLFLHLKTASSVPLKKKKDK